MSIELTSTIGVSLPSISARGGRSREVLVGHDAFMWLKSFQQSAPAPRLELRYFTEGAVWLLTGAPDLKAEWEHSAKAALLAHLQADLDQEGADPMRNTLPNGQGEGAEARIQEQAKRPCGPDSKCRAVHVGESVFEELRRLQDAARDPRAGLRYWMEGAMSLLRRRGDLHGAWLVHARTAMQAHLSKLQQSASIPPNS